MKVTDKNIAIFKKWYIKDCTVRNKDFSIFPSVILKRVVKRVPLLKTMSQKVRLVYIYTEILMIVYHIKHLRIWGKCI